MGDFIAKTLETTGYVGLVFLMFVENVFPPIPSELIMPLAGYLAAKEKLVLWGVIVAGTIGSVLGALPLYKLGEKVGEARLKRLAAKHGRWLSFCPADVDRAERWFAKHGHLAVFFGRLVPGLRSLVSIPAGIHRMPMPQFLVATTLGSALWTAALAGLGYVLGARFEEVDRWLNPVSTVIIAAIVLVYVVRVIRFDAKAGESN